MASDEIKIPKVPRSDNEVKTILGRSFKNSLKAIQNEVKQLAPVDTGHLRDSITWEVTKETNEEFEGIVGTNISYARAQEYGVEKHTRLRYDRTGEVIGTYEHPGFEGRFYFQKGIHLSKPKVNRILRRGLFKALSWK